MEPYARLYRRGAYVEPEYRRALGARVTPLLLRHGLGAGAALRGLHVPAPPAGPAATPAGGQLALL